MTTARINYFIRDYKMDVFGFCHSFYTYQLEVFYKPVLSDNI